MSVFIAFFTGITLWLAAALPAFANPFATPGSWPVAYQGTVPYPPAYYRYPRPQPRTGHYGWPVPGALPRQNGPVNRSSVHVPERDRGQSTNAAPLSGGGSSQAGGKKQQFIETLLPHIRTENRRLAKLRGELLELLARLERDSLDQSGRSRLKALARLYRVDNDPVTDAAARQELVRKIDIIPASLTLAQAANESAWGSSRFAREAKNLFGIWTYDESQGLVPKNREQGKEHLVRVFADYGESVRYYMHTLNSHPAYRELRTIRQQLRSARKTIEGHQLASGLEQYSAQGRDYIDLIRSLIRQNEWARLDADNQSA